ncbi:MAG: EamA family transporter [Gemmatimonadales bacterium]|nr:MAG: EamA family transporter [Gemmatimonadales bacterium]
MRTLNPPARIALAYSQVILAGSLWATSGPISVALFRLGIPPTSVAILRPAAGVLFLLAIVAVRWASRSTRPPGAALPNPRPEGNDTDRTGQAQRRADLAGMILLGGIIVGIFQVAYQMSTDSVGVPATVALLYLAPALVIAASAVLFGERITPAKALLAAISIAGVWLTVLGTRGVDLELTLGGVLWGCLCGIAYAAYTLFGKWYGRHYGPLIPLFWSTAAGTVLLGLVWMARGEEVVLPGTPTELALVLLLGLLTIALAALLLFNAMRTLEAGRASIGTTVEPMMAAILAWLFLDQVLTPWGVVGLVVLVVGVAGAYAVRTPATADER